MTISADVLDAATRAYHRCLDDAVGDLATDLRAAMPVVREVIAATLPDLADQIREIVAGDGLPEGWAIPVAPHPGWSGGDLAVTAQLDGDAWDRWTMPLLVTLTADPAIGRVETTAKSLPHWLRAVLDPARRLSPGAACHTRVTGCASTGGPQHASRTDAGP